MKKVLLSAVALVAFGFAAQAQDMKFGAKAGVNFANLGGDADGDMKTGFHVGALAEFKLTEKFSIQPELYYSTQGSKTEESNTETAGGVTYSVSQESKVNLGYLNLPILAKYYLTEGLSIQAGPQVGFLLSAEAENEWTETAVAGTVTTTDSGSMTVDIKDGTKSIDFGVTAGLEYELPMGLFFQARYYAGLTDISEEVSGSVGGVSYSSNPKTTNNVIQVSVGFKF